MMRLLAIFSNSTVVSGRHRIFGNRVFSGFFARIAIFPRLSRHAAFRPAPQTDKNADFPGTAIVSCGYDKVVSRFVNRGGASACPALG